MAVVDRVGVWLALLLPVLLLHGRGLAEGVIGVLGVLFLAQSAVRRDWGWLRLAWMRIGLVWWGWVVVCSVPHGGAAVEQAAASGRFLLLVAALAHWVLRDARVRSWFAWVLRWSAIYIAVQSLVQFAVGKNLFGYPRSGDGELTGPYEHPRAGAPLSRLLFPAVLPVWRQALLPVGVVVMVLIGQRMPLLLTGLGLVVTALLMPQLRRLVLVAAVVLVALVAATPVVSPPTFHRLVEKFLLQMGHFATSDYGLIAGRAVVIAQANPLLGAGFDGFRRDCEDKRYFHGWGGGDGGGAAMCNQHPHNFYLQALVEGGVPGLLLFSLLAGAWLVPLGRGLWTAPDPLRVGLFVAALLHLWPIASSTAWTSMPLGGWFFVLLGLGLAETQHYINCPGSSKV